MYCMVYHRYASAWSIVCLCMVFYMLVYHLLYACAWWIAWLFMVYCMPVQGLLYVYALCIVYCTDILPVHGLLYACALSTVCICIVYCMHLHGLLYACVLWACMCVFGVSTIWMKKTLVKDRNGESPDTFTNTAFPASTELRNTLNNNWTMSASIALHYSALHYIVVYVLYWLAISYADHKKIIWKQKTCF